MPALQSWLPPGPLSFVLLRLGVGNPDLEPPPRFGPSCSTCLAGGFASADPISHGVRPLRAAPVTSSPKPRRSPPLCLSVPGPSDLLQANISSPTAEGQKDGRKERREGGKEGWSWPRGIWVQTPTPALSLPLQGGLFGFFVEGRGGEPRTQL